MSAPSPATIASLLPSSTEILFALGLEKKVVAVSHECDWPPRARGLPVLTEKKIDTDRSSREIDDAIAALGAKGESVYRVRADLLAKLRPELIVTQDECDVCAVTTSDVRSALEEAGRLAPGYAPRILSLRPATLDDVFGDIRRVGEAAGALGEAEALLRDLEIRRRAVTDSVASDAAIHPRVTAIDWVDPLILGGDWIPELVRAAGGTPQPTPEGKAARIPWEDVRAFAPEVIVVMPCGFDLERAVAETALLAALPGWDEIPAVRYDRVYAVDGNALFNRPSQRIVDSLEAMAEMLHPNLFRGTVTDPENLYRRIPNRTSS